MPSQISRHEACTFAVLLLCGWTTSAELAARLDGVVSARAVRAYLNRWAGLNIVDVADVWPPRYRRAKQGDKTYLTHLERAAAVMDVQLGAEET